MLLSMRKVFDQGRLCFFITMSFIGCGNDQLMELAQAEADYSKTFEPATLTVSQESGRHYAKCVNTTCRDSGVFFRAGSVRVSVELAAAPETAPKARLLQCDFADEVDQNGFLKVTTTTQNEPARCTTLRDVTTAIAMSGSGKTWEAEIPVENSSQSARYREGLAEIRIDIGTRLDGRPVKSLRTETIIDTSPETTPETQTVRQTKGSDSASTFSVSPNQSTLTLQFDEDMQTATHPKFSLVIASSIAGLESVYAPVIPEAVYVNRIAWTSARTLTVTDLPATFGFLPENSNVFWQITGAKTAAGKTYMAMRRTFSIAGASYAYATNVTTGINGKFAVQASGVTFSVTYGQAAPVNYSGNQDIIRDNNTGLRWTKCSIGQSGGACGVVSQTFLDFNSASSACIALGQTNFGGYSRWRLPTTHELTSIMDVSLNPMIPASFPATLASDYWTLTFEQSVDLSGFTQVQSGQKKAAELLTLNGRVLNFALGTTSSKPVITDRAYARCVTDEAVTPALKNERRYDTMTTTSGSAFAPFRVVTTGSAVNTFFHGCSYGAVPAAATACNIAGNSPGVSYSTALNFCTSGVVGNVVIGGNTYTPRLPTIYELLLLEDFDKNDYLGETLGIKLPVTPKAPNTRYDKPYWTSTAVNGLTNYGYVHLFRIGTQILDRNGGLGYARCVWS